MRLNLWKMKTNKIATEKSFCSKISLIVFLLSSIVVTMGAVLPILAAKLYDSSVIGKMNYEEMKIIELETQKLSIMEKLELMRRGTAISVVEDSAVKTQKDIEELVKNKLKRYVERGLIQEDIRDCRYECRPYLYYALEKNHIFWEVFVLYGREQRQLLRLLVDDEKGLICHISYESTQSMKMEEWKVLWYRFYELCVKDFGLQNKVLYTYEGKNGMDNGGVVRIVSTEGKDMEDYIHLRIHKKGFYSVVGVEE